MYGMKPAIKPTGTNAPYLTILAAILLLFSLYMLSAMFITPVKPDFVLKHTPAPAEPQEHRVRIFTLPEQQAQPDRPKPTATNSSDMSASKGKKPAIDATFSMPVQAYVKTLEQRGGAKLILFDSAHGRVMGEVAGRHVKTGHIQLHGMSMRARDITTDLPDAFQDHVFNQIGERARTYRFLIVLPMSTEQQFEKRLAEKLGSLGITWADISSISLRYEQSGSHINARIEKININGVTRKIGRMIEVW